MRHFDGHESYRCYSQVVGSTLLGTGIVMNKIFVVIPVHNRILYTQSCLLSLRDQRFRNYEVVVVDDGSTDGTGDMVITEFPEVTLLRGDGNLWWSASTNLGVEYALDEGADYIITLNNDTLVAEDFLEKMFLWAEKTPNSLLGAFAIDAGTKKPVYGGERINWITAGYVNLLAVLDKEQWTGLHEVTHFPGRGLLIPSIVFKKIGLFAADIFPQSAADEDFTHRAIRAGFPVYCNYDARIHIYPNESGDAVLRNKKSLFNYWGHLFSFKGGGNIMRFVHYAIRNAPRRFLIPFLISGITRRILGYPRDWIEEYARQIKKGRKL